MNRGKSICNTLKGIRQKVADENGIDYKPEVRYLDQRLNAMRLAGKAVRIAGISLGITALTACHSSKKPSKDIYPLEGEPPIRQEDTRDVPLMGKPAIPVDTLNLISTQEDGTKVFGMAEMMPNFRGGQQALQEYIKENLHYPSDGTDVQGRVIVTFTIEKDGSISEPKVVKSLSEACDQEALRLVKNMPKWTPGKQDGKCVPVKYTIPIDFKNK